VNEDEMAADSKKVCWSPAGGVSNMTGGDATELGTIRDESEVIEKVVASSGSVIQAFSCLPHLRVVPVADFV
jgi:hypothetical protein